ncbi:hypothetical protein HOC13_04790 [Candidatus Woesearchaeota archaeon]|jgi:hypothetical protein|nr:hypothetical protein [Candidatus Woesearchaeota archaeon]
MKEFPFIEIENKKYPTVIMGEDHFTGWFKKCRKYDSEEERENAYRETLEIAYSLGVRGFSMSPHSTLIKVLKEFKKKHPEIVCISNHHWHTNYYLGDKSLWLGENLERLGASEAFYYDEEIIKDSSWFKDANIEKRFSKEEINSFRLDEEEYQQQLAKFSFCDFSLVGNLGRSALINLGREDIVKREIELVREKGSIPIGLCEGGGLALLKYEKMEVAGTWIWINRHEACPNLDYALKMIKKAKKPITAYRVFASPEGFNLEKSISFIKNVEQIKSIVVGIDSKEQAEETFSKLHDYWN